MFSGVWKPLISGAMGTYEVLQSVVSTRAFLQHELSHMSKLNVSYRDLRATAM